MSSLADTLSCCLNSWVARQGDSRLEMIRQQTARSHDIDMQLRKEKKYTRKRQMILLLGTGESGKSTFLKQMRIINCKCFSDSEVAQFRITIYDNIYKGILFLIQARQKLGIPWAGGSDCPAERASHILDQNYLDTRLVRRERLRQMQSIWLEEEFLAIVDELRLVWADNAIRQAFDQRSKMITEDFSENIRYYCTRLDVIGTKGYIPTNEDIVWSRRPTDSIIEEEIALHGTRLVFIDVGGQTKERRKWCQCFTGMTSVLFLVACSHFDEHYRDRLTREFRNKLQESMIIFNGLINHVAFRRVSVIIFFNKTDILKEKVASRTSNIRDTFPNFPQSYDPFKLHDVQTFLVDTFASMVDHTFADPISCFINRAPTLQYCGHTSASFPSSIDSSNYGQRRQPLRPSLMRISISNRFGPSDLARRASERQQSNGSTREYFANTATANIFTGVSNINAPLRRRMVYRHFTTAIDRRNMETVFEAMRDSLLENNLRRIMMN